MRGDSQNFDIATNECSKESARLSRNFLENRYYKILEKKKNYNTYVTFLAMEMLAMQLRTIL